MATKREALNTCGRLKKGFRFRKGGRIVKGKKAASTSKGKRTSKKTGRTGSLF